MEGYLTLTEAAEKLNVTTRLLSLYCNTGRIKGAQRAGKMWLVPVDFEMPSDKRFIHGKYVGYRERFKGTYRKSQEDRQKKKKKTQDSV